MIRSDHWELLNKADYGLVTRYRMITNDPINFANEINKLLNNFVIVNPFCFTISVHIPDLMTYYRGGGVNNPNKPPFRLFWGQNGGLLGLKIQIILMIVVKGKLLNIKFS